MTFVLKKIRLKKEMVALEHNVIWYSILRPSEKKGSWLLIGVHGESQSGWFSCLLTSWRLI